MELRDSQGHGHKTGMEKRSLWRIIASKIIWSVREYDHNHDKIANVILFSRLSYFQ